MFFQYIISLLLQAQAHLDHPVVKKKQGRKKKSIMTSQRK